MHSSVEGVGRLESSLGCRRGREVRVKLVKALDEGLKGARRRDVEVASERAQVRERVSVAEGGVGRWRKSAAELKGPGGPLAKAVPPLFSVKLLAAQRSRRAVPCGRPTRAGVVHPPGEVLQVMERKVGVVEGVRERHMEGEEEGGGVESGEREGGVLGEGEGEEAGVGVGWVERVGVGVGRLRAGVGEEGGEGEEEGEPAAVGEAASAGEALEKGVLIVVGEPGAVAEGLRVRGEALGVNV